MRYQVKKDLWIIFLMYSPLLLAIGMIIALQGDSLFLVLVVMGPVGALTLWICYGSYYELRDEELYIRFGPFHQKIKYHKIKSFRETRNFLSSAAMSLDRIEIREHDKSFAMGTTYVSPLDKDEFMRALKSNCNNLEK